jgi:Zn-dependent protease with chaperone function
VPIRVTCDRCQHTLDVQDDWAGKRGKCPQCQAVVQVPAAANAASRAAAAPPAAVSASPAVVGGRPNFATHKSAVPTKTSAASSSQTPAAAKPASAQSGRSKIAPAPLTAEQLRSRVLAGFIGEVPRQSTSLRYRLGILLTALFMVLLPLAYIGIIALACYGVYLHLAHNHVMLGAARGRGAVFVFLAFLAPLVIAAVIIVFMIKPLFARPAKEGRRRSVTPHSDPLLFEFVERICRLVGAPIPRRIDIDCDINASAGFRRGWLSLITGNDLVLRIGMPLAAGMSLQQFAGILAHEFGHFSQGTGMRLTYIIRSINHWFVRVVYERDSWDEWLATSADGMDLRIAWVLWLARAGVWITRKILWVLMFLGHVVAGFMLRQMEFDADRYEAHLAGSTTFASTCRRLRQLGVAWQVAQGNLSSYYAEGRLVDNLPRLMMWNVEHPPPAVQKWLARNDDEAKSSWLDSHPSDPDRIAAAMSEKAPGAFRSDLPASVLFANFDAAGKNVTWDYYCSVFGRTIDPHSLNPTEDLLARQQQEQVCDDARDRYFVGGFTSLRPLRLPVFPFGPPQAAAIWREELVAARQAMAAGAAAYCATLQPYDQADTRLIQSRQARSILSSNVRLQRDKFEQAPASTSDASLARDRALAQLGRMSGSLESFEDAAGRRLRAALLLLAEPALADRLPNAPAMHQEAKRLLPIVTHVGTNHASILELRNCNAVLVALLGHLEGQERNELLIREILEFSGRVREQTAAVRNLFAGIDYPFDHAQGPVTVSRFLLPMIPPAEEVGSIYQAADELLSGLMSLNARCLGRLCKSAEAVETALGLPPLPSGKPKEADE